jgi:hypothetical protein
MGSKLRGIGSLLGLGMQGRWPQQQAVAAEMAAHASSKNEQVASQYGRAPATTDLL